MSGDCSRQGIEQHGFSGFVSFDRLGSLPPAAPGVYVVIRTSRSHPSFLPSNAASRQKGRDPSVSVETLAAAWVADAQTVYVGKATSLRARLAQYRRHGAGTGAGHWGGRYIWQLADHAELLVAWRETPGESPAEVESALIAEFMGDFGARPFANRNMGRRASLPSVETDV